jgi:RNA polymerase sigma-70 factor (ECF subfamily)
VTALLSPDEEAQFFDFHAKTSVALFQKAYRMCRGHEADARDALQRAYFKALRNWAVVGDLSEPRRSAWLVTTLSNEVLQIWRAPSRSRETSSDEGEGGPPAALDIAESVHHRDRLRRVCRAIASLEGRPGEVMALHCLAGYEIPEVAEILGITPETVRVHLHTARTRVREIMAGEEDQHDHA